MRKRKKVMITFRELKNMAKQADETNVTSLGILVTMLFLGVLCILGFVYRLHMICSCLILGAGVCVIPIVLYYHYYQKKENIRFYTERFGFKITGEEKDGTVVVYQFQLKC